MIKKEFNNAAVAEIFATYPQPLKKKLLALRQLIFDVAESIKQVGELEETIKWGQPSYLTTVSKSGSLIRLDVVKSQIDTYAMYFHCQTNLIATFRCLYPNVFFYVGNRAIFFKGDEEISLKKLKHCIVLALTYNLVKSGKFQIKIPL